MLDSPAFYITINLLTVPGAIVFGMWFWRVRRGKSVPQPSEAIQLVVCGAVILGFYLLDAFQSASQENEAATLWHIIGTFNVGLSLAFSIAINRLAEDSAARKLRERNFD